MRAVDIIAKKRDGHPLTTEEIDFFVQGFTQGEIPDYQAASLLMAIYTKGMNEQETVDLTLSMARSGKMLDLSPIAPFVVDKHSTGGVGDKTTLVVAPLVAAAGLPVGKISGRGLGFSGGTLDKLESIPGFKANLSGEEFMATLRDCGIVVVGQTADMVPADGKFYALRDVTATVSNISLIASSIMSKKIASGANAIVLDVKAGLGAFMQTMEEAMALAHTMVNIGQALDRRVAAVISNMNQPLGRAVGNALELKEAIVTLHGHGPTDFLEHCLIIASQMLLLADRAPDAQEARKLLLHELDSGRAWRKFRDWIVSQGGDQAYIDDPSLLPQATLVEALPSPRSGYIAGLDAMEVGLTVALLGGGRARKGDSIDHAVGVVLAKKIGDYVKKGEALLIIHANDEQRLADARRRLLDAYSWSDEPVERPPLVHEIISAETQSSKSKAQSSKR
ncbi:MAG: pyrimidine-nucleoside phosphorylase [Anaerolineae bacterium]|nr:pyrimidine-nucleoside phosphorylase [Anaerolineae bacterium]